MAHTFLLEPGSWSIQGNWLERDQNPIAVKGRTIIAWSADGMWFTMATKLLFPDTDREAISFQYKGRLDATERFYTFVLQHSALGRIEGEGWLAPESILQRYWVMGDRQKRSGFETLYRVNTSTYHLSSALMSRELISTMEAMLERLPEG